MSKTAQVLIWAGISVALLAFGYKMYNQVHLAKEYCWRIAGIAVKRFSRELIEFELLVRFLNKSTLEATITGFNFDIFINDKKIANIARQTSIIVQKQGVTAFSLPVSLNPSTKFTFNEIVSLAANYLSKAGQDKIKVKIAGIINVKAYGVNIKNIDVNIAYSIKELLESDPNAPVCPEKF